MGLTLPHLPLWFHLAAHTAGFALGIIGALVFVFVFGNWHAGKFCL